MKHPIFYLHQQFVYQSADNFFITFGKIKENEKFKQKHRKIKTNISNSLVSKVFFV